MKGMVIYHSKYGNCKQVAGAIFEALKASGVDVSLSDVVSLTALPKDLDFVVVGSPTRAGHASGPIKKFFKGVSGPPLKFAAFGTGLAKGVAKGDDIAAEGISKILKEKSFIEVVPPLRAAVNGWKGPLADGELEKATAFGKAIAAELASDRVAAPAPAAGAAPPAVAPATTAPAPTPAPPAAAPPAAAPPADAPPGDGAKPPE